MSIFDGVIGGIVSAGITTLVNNVLQQHGGLQGLVNQFQQNGLAQQVNSWVGTGANMPIQASQIQQVLGSDMIKNLAAKVGVSESDVAAKLAEFLPSAVDKMTPNGQVPAAA